MRTNSHRVPIGVLAVAGAVFAGAPSTLSISPDRIYLFGAEATQHIIVTQKGPDGVESDVTSAASLRLAAPKYVTVANGDLLRAIQPGFTMVTANYKGLQAQ